VCPGEVHNLRAAIIFISQGQFEDHVIMKIQPLYHNTYSYKVTSVSV